MAYRSDESLAWMCHSIHACAHQQAYSDVNVEISANREWLHSRCEIRFLILSAVFLPVCLSISPCSTANAVRVNIRELSKLVHQTESFAVPKISLFLLKIWIFVRIILIEARVSNSNEGFLKYYNTFLMTCLVAKLSRTSNLWLPQPLPESNGVPWCHGSDCHFPKLSMNTSC